MTTLAPQVRELLASLSATPPAPPWEVPLASYRSAGERLAALAGAPHPGCDVRNFTMRLPGRLLDARAYRPKGATGSLAGVVYFHGGGFVRGSLDSHDRLCRELSARGGFSVIAVAYRLAPEHVFPDAHDDAIDSFCWVAEHADELEVRRDALAVAGDSAGAMLAAWTAVGLQERYRAARPRALGLLCPVLDATLTNGSVTRHANAPFLSRAVLSWCIEQYFPDVQDRHRAPASPSMTPGLTGAPPAVIVSAEIDPVSDDARQFSARLEDAGVRSELHEYPGMPHSFFLMAGVLDQGERAIGTFAERLSALLCHEATALHDGPEGIDTFLA